MLKFPFHCAKLAAVALALGLCACSQIPGPVPELAPDAVFTVQGGSQHASVRVLTRAAHCPDIEWDGGAAQAMLERAAPGTMALRSGGGRRDSKPALFDVLTCEAQWPAGVTRARVGAREVPAPHTRIGRIVIVADTGCRMKASDNAFQACFDAVQWPFARIAASAAALHPDLVLHLGDMHYRESPCPTRNEGCANSPWGYGYDAWKADFFEPAQPLLAAAPWVFVRGNHESCARAGQGWFRFIDVQPWTQARSCNDPARDDDADYSPPYGVAVASDAQLLVFDSSRASGRPLHQGELAFEKYTQQLQSAARLGRERSHNFFLSHHPLLAVETSKQPGSFKAVGNASLQSVFGTLYPQRLLPDDVAVSLHGHVHVFESISFKGAQPASLIMGNSGSAAEGAPPAALTAGALLYPGAEVQDYMSAPGYGFATLDRIESAAPDQWLLTEYTPDGVALLECVVAAGKSRCHAVTAPAH